MKSQLENPRGLHSRYAVKKLVAKNVTKKELYGKRTSHTTIFVERAVDKKAEYFVLRLDENGKDKEHIKACRIAAHAYADAIEHYLPKLAEDLRTEYPLL